MFASSEPQLKRSPMVLGFALALTCVNSTACVNQTARANGAAASSELDAGSIHDAGPPLEAASFYCAETCRKTRECELDAGVSDCEQRCLEAPYGHAVEPHLLKSATECVVEESCERFAGDAAWPSCLETAEADQVESDACLEFCDELGYVSFECGSRAGLIEQYEACLNWACAFSDAVLNEALACSELEECGERYACLDEAFSIE